MRLSRAALLPEVEEQATLPELLQHVDPEAGAAELDLAADTAQSASSQLAARQGEALECVTQELLANPDILRCAHHTDYCAYSVASCATVEHHPPFLMACIPNARGSLVCNTKQCTKGVVQDARAWELVRVLTTVAHGGLLQAR